MLSSSAVGQNKIVRQPVFGHVLDQHFIGLDKMGSPDPFVQTLKVVDLGLSGIDPHHHRAENDKHEQNQNSDATLSACLGPFRFLLFHFISPYEFLEGQGDFRLPERPF